MAASAAFVESAPAKVNLTLRVVRRLPDGYHEIESLVAFADFADTLSLTVGGELALAVRGERATQAGPTADNLVLKAARALTRLVPGLAAGAFDLHKRVPVAAGLGGGSADAAAALRLLARANGLSGDDPRLYEAARATGADVPVCLDPRPRLMSGIGEVLSGPLDLPKLPAVIVNPGVALATKAVFEAWRPAAAPPDRCDAAAIARSAGREDLLQLLLRQSNDLEAAAMALEPAVAAALAALRALPECRLVRMSGSGATCFALFGSAAQAISGATALRAAHPRWWVHASALGGYSSAEAGEETAAAVAAKAPS